MSEERYLADCHTHSRVSPDARDTMSAMAEAAFRAGFRELCITDHVEPMEFGTDRPRTGYDWGRLTSEFDQAKAAWGGRLTLRLGVELGDAPWDEALCSRLLSAAPPLDFIIGSVHTLSPAMGSDLFHFTPADEAEARRGIADYLELVRKTVLWGQFSVLGHLTLPLRYLNENQGFSLTFDGFESEVSEIFRLLIGRGLGIEVNTNRGGMPLPDGKWLTLYRSLGGEIVTLGSDAHSAKDVGRGIPEGQALLRACGFRRFCTFTAMKPVWHEL